MTDVDGIELLQVPSEWEPLLELYRKRAPRRVLEIGCWQGGSLRAWLRESDPPPELVVAIDPEHQRPELYEGWRREPTELIVIHGSSQDPQIIADVEMFAGRFDWLFIDGDHLEPAVRSDVELCRRVAAPGAALILHDVALGTLNEGSPAPATVFSELSAEGLEVECFVESPYGGNWAHGVGVVYLP